MRWQEVTLSQLCYDFCLGMVKICLKVCAIHINIIDSLFMPAYNSQQANYKETMSSKESKINQNNLYILKIFFNLIDKMESNKNINDQLKVIYNAIGLLPKINGTYLTQRREGTQQSKSRDQFENKKRNHNLDLDKIKRKLTFQLKKQSLIDQKDKKHLACISKERRSVTESSPMNSLEQQLKALAQQQKLHIIKLSEFLRLRTRQAVLWNNYQNCLSKLYSKRQRSVSNRTVEQKKQKKVNYFIPENKPIVFTKGGALKIKINKCDMYELDNSESSINKSKCEKKYSFNQRVRMKNYKNKEGEILPKGEKLITQVCNQTKLNRWEYNDSKFKPYKKKLERLNDSWGMDHDDVYL